MPPSIYPTGVTVHRPDRAWPGYVLYDGRDGRSFLIDMNGNLVHSWPYTGFPVEMIDPGVNAGRRGDLICQKEPEIFSNETLLKVDWDGNIIWEWGAKAPGGKAAQNHDQAPLPNGNLLVLAKLAGVHPDDKDRPIDDQAIYEVNSEEKWSGPGFPRGTSKSWDSRAKKGNCCSVPGCGPGPASL